MNTKQIAIIKKDMSCVTSNKQVFAVMLIVPLALTIILPSVLVLVTVLVPDAMADFQMLLNMLPVTAQTGDPKLLILELMLNKIMPIFFLMIPIMASSVMAASSFVGEKEKHTLETLLYSPLPLKQLFQSKILASFSVAMLVSLISFVAMLVVLETELLLLTGTAIMPAFSWIIVMLLVAPSISLVAISITVRGSAKAQTMEEAQQRAVFLIFPIIALVIGQFTGVLMVGSWLFLGMGVILALLAVLLMKGSAGKFTYEKLLR